MAQVVIYSTAQCPFCRRAEALLAQKGVSDLQKIEVDTDPEQLALMIERSGRRSVPQIFIDDVHVGGFDDLVALDKAGKLQPLLSILCCGLGSKWARSDKGNLTTFGLHQAKFAHGR